eukprot:COSAG06_NODE_7502_length_2482_cov_12.172801_3_plen_124_part_00
MRIHIAHFAIIAMRACAGQARPHSHAPPSPASNAAARLSPATPRDARCHRSQLPHFLLPAAWLADSNWVWTLPACVTHDRESFKNTPRGGHADAAAPARTVEEAAQEMREGKGAGILGGSGVA